MGLFDYIFRPSKAKESIKALNDSKGFFQTLTAYQPVFTSWGGQIYESELVRAAIDARARHISKLSVEIQGAANPKLQAKMRLAPNKLMNYSQFMYRCSTILDVNNTLFVVPVFDDNMVITGYYPVVPTNASVIEYKGEPWVRFQFNGKTSAVKLTEMAILTKFQYLSDFFGSSNRALDNTMQLVDIVRQTIQESAKQSVVYRFMAKLDNFSTIEDLAKERQRFTEANLTNKSSKGGLLLFPSKYSSIQQLSQSAYKVDAAQMELIQTNVFNYFGVNMDIIQNKANADQLDAFFNGAIEPFAIQFSDAMTMAMFSERERAQGSRLVCNANRLQYMSTSQKVQMSKELGDRGAITIDEIRALFNYPPLPDGAGQMAPIRGEYYNANQGDNNASEE
ncbi:MAG: phage portal protein [Paludibacteraceae bacterium]|nr:phage portal protein [Paludibacteraceae bacterium]